MSERTRETSGFGLVSCTATSDSNENSTGPTTDYRLGLQRRSKFLDQHRGYGRRQLMFRPNSSEDVPRSLANQRPNLLSRAQRIVLQFMVELHNFGCQ